MKRWYCVEQKLQNGNRVFVGRVEATEDELRDAVGPYADINPVNGECYVWGKPKS